MKRIAVLATTGVLVLAPAFGMVAAHAAGGDDPTRTGVVTTRHGEPEPGDDHGRHHHRHDDRAVNGRHGEAEPGDDHGRHHHGENEPGDDHGGRHHGESEPGDHHGDDD
jgi:hypothetical protein